MPPNRRAPDPPEELLKAAAASILGTEARVSRRLDFDNVNGVYSVEAGGRAYALKVFTHALVHDDRTPKNAVLKVDGGLVFVDWDDAVGAFRVRITPGRLTGILTRARAAAL